MEFASQLDLLNSAYDIFSQRQWIGAQQAAVPVIQQMNRELLAATKNSYLKDLQYKRLYLSHSDYLLVMLAHGFASTSLDAVTAISWNKYFNDASDSHTLVGSLIRRGKMYGVSDRQVDQRAVSALSFLAATVAKKLCRPGDLQLVVSIPSSSNSTNRLPRQLAEAAARTSSRYELAGSETLVRCRDFGQMKNIIDFDEKMSVVKGSMRADSSAVHGRKVLLIDDLLGSGGTLREAARALKFAGAIEVQALVMAKTRKFAMRTMCKP